MGPMPVTTVTAIETSGARGRARLESVAAENLERKRRKLSRELAEARREREAYLRSQYRPAPGTVRPAVQPGAVPLTFKAAAAEPKRRRVTRPATDTAPAPVESAPVKPAEFTPVLAAKVPKHIKALAKIHRDRGDLTDVWFMIGFTDNADGTRTDYYAIRFGNNCAKYAVAA